MNETIKNEKNPGNTKDHANRPMWMDKDRQLSWDKVKQTITTEFNKAHEGALSMEHRISDKALEFGHAAREAFQKLGEWGDEVENQLKVDWAKFESDANHNWDKVKAAVKAGFQKAERPSGHVVGKA